jgi:hypothetical protein
VTFERRVSELGLQLPPKPLLPPEVRIPFDWVRVVGERCVLSGHGALTPDGAPAGTFGRVPREVPLAAAQESARLLEVFGEHGRHARSAILFYRHRH